MTAITEKQLTISTLLQHSKKRVGFTLASLAKHAGVAEVTAETWISGRYLPTRRYHQAICEHTRTHRSRFAKVYERQMEERRDQKRSKLPCVVEVPSKKQVAQPQVKETTSRQWAIELALEVSKFDAERYQLFMDVLAAAGKELKQ